MLFAAGGLVGFGARTAGGCTSGHGLTASRSASARASRRIGAIMGSAIAVSLLLEALL